MSPFRSTTGGRIAKRIVSLTPSLTPSMKNTTVTNLVIFGPVTPEMMRPSALCGRLGSVLFFSRPRSEGWYVLSPFISVLCHSDWLFRGGVLSTYWCCPSRQCVVFLACVHLTVFHALSLSPGIFLTLVGPNMAQSLSWLGWSVSLWRSSIRM